MEIKTVESVDEFKDNDAYHRDTKFVTSSMLKCLRESPRLYESKYVKGEVPQERKRAFDIGHAVHTKVLEPQEYAERFAVESEGVNRRTKEYQAMKRDAMAAGKVLLSSDDNRLVERAESSLRKHPIISRILEAEGDVERTLTWTDAATGVLCKFRADKMVHPLALPRMLFDIKTAADSGERGFTMSAAKFGYHLQAAHYIEGAASVTGTNVADWMLVFGVVRTDHPFDSFAYQLDQRSLDSAFELRTRLLRSLKQRTDDNDFAAFGEAELVTITLPDWALTENVK
tara:strand:- start:126 stop:983 length:858 start_codon:yes stop_codon:yes gene_type:complete